MMRFISWCVCSIWAISAAAVELPHTLKCTTYGFQIGYPSDWEEQSADSDVVTYYSTTPLAPNPVESPNARYVLAGPEKGGFRPTLNLQPRGLVGGIDERTRRDMVASVRAIAGRVAGVSFELVDDRIEELPGGRAVVVDFRFNDAHGRRLRSCQWLFALEDKLLASYTDTAEDFEKGRPTLEAMMASFKMFAPPPLVGYDEVVNLWVTIALLVSLSAAGSAYVLYRRVHKVEEYADGEPVVPGATPPSGSA